jgi:hypothetical protein
LAPAPVSRPKVMPGKAYVPSMPAQPSAPEVPTIKTTSAEGQKMPSSEPAPSADELISEFVDPEV